MTSVLNTEIETLEALEAADGRFFVPEDGQLPFPETDGPEPQADTSLRQCIADQEPLMKAAHLALSKLRRAQVLVETDALIKGVVDPDVLEESRLDCIDQGTVWRSCTDRISHSIAGKFPNQVLADPMFDTEDAVHITTSHKVYRIDSDLTVWCFASYIDQIEMNRGVRIATEEMWEELLFGMSITTAMNSRQSHS